MESNAMFRYVVRLWAPLAALLLLCVLIGGPASTSAQNAEAPDVPLPELEGSWTPTNNEDLSNDTVPVDYMGLPLTEEGRARALSYNESQLGMIERQCEGWSPTYFLTGPFGMKIWAQSDPARGNIIKYTIGAWHDKLPQEIWMDGRPHPSKYADHTRSGFATGSWDGSTLVVRTTHMKASFVRKNGPPLSDQATMTNRFYRHGNLLTVLGIIEDAVYLAEPVIWTRNYQVSATRMYSVAPPCIVTFEGTTAVTDVPHFLWGKKPERFMNELPDKYGIPREAVLGYPETLYPEYHQKMMAASKR
jgi:hypothetical protein